MTLKSRLALRLVFMPVMWGSLLFLPAGSFRFWQGWAYFIITLTFILSILDYLYRHDPQLIERRLGGGWRQETVREQKLIMKLSAATMLIAFLLPGFDHRFGWSHSPLWLTILSQAFVLGGYLMIFWTLKSNSFAASTIRVEAGRRFRGRTLQRGRRGGVAVHYLTCCRSNLGQQPYNRTQCSSGTVVSSPSLLLQRQAPFGEQDSSSARSR